jgi:hypothetical protein
MELPRQAPVGGKRAGAGDEARVFDASHRPVIPMVLAARHRVTSSLHGFVNSSPRPFVTVS